MAKISDILNNKQIIKSFVTRQVNQAKVNFDFITQGILPVKDESGKIIGKAKLNGDGTANIEFEDGREPVNVPWSYDLFPDQKKYAEVVNKKEKGASKSG